MFGLAPFLSNDSVTPSWTSLTAKCSGKSSDFPRRIGILSKRDEFLDGFDAARRAGHMKMGPTGINVDVIQVKSVVDIKKTGYDIGIRPGSAMHYCGTTQHRLSVFVQFGLVLIARASHEVNETDCTMMIYGTVEKLFDFFGPKNDQEVRKRALPIAD
ncbi:unnamed protein product [Trichogramma brassicae]|uniref:Uncharacterized protein n=1 Tax=Trichogramma brassicae TaxID=86971 RepID=A0A6H5JAL7_9HYME|nr:unnamed protein product [Trichogramma brassicae]